LVASPYGDETEIFEFAPCSVRGNLSAGHTTPDEWEKFINDMEELWRKMEAQFRRALQAGMCRLFARCGEPTAEHFREINADLFRFFRVIDWDRGVAEDDLGNRLYSLHAAPPTIAEETDEDAINLELLEEAMISGVPSSSLEPETEKPNSGGQRHRDTEVQEEARRPASNNASIDGAGGDELLTIEDAMAILKVGRSTLYTLLGENKIKKIKIRGRTLVSKNSLIEFIREITLE
jgi:excisionase family DNA binding protein